jgi:hypothetical protein
MKKIGTKKICFKLKRAKNLYESRQKEFSSSTQNPNQPIKTKICFKKSIFSTLKVGRPRIVGLKNKRTQIEFKRP